MLRWIRSNPGGKGEGLRDGIRSSFLGEALLPRTGDPRRDAELRRLFYSALAETIYY